MKICVRLNNAEFELTRHSPRDTGHYPKTTPHSHFRPHVSGTVLCRPYGRRGHISLLGRVSGLQVGFGEATATPAVSQLSSLRRVYTGAWQKGHMSGSGTMTWPDGHLEAAMARGVRKWRKFKFEDEINRQNEAQEIGDVNRICDDRQSKKLGVRFQV